MASLEEKLDKEKQKGPLLRLVPGSKDGDGNWLLELNEGSVFLCRPIQRGNEKPSFELLQFHVMKKWKRAVWLHRNFPRVDEDIFVDSIIFSNNFELIELQEDGSTDYSNTGPSFVENDVNNTG